MCNNCIHKAVCGKCKATGGHVGKCEHFAQEKRGRWVHDLSHLYGCSVCGQRDVMRVRTKRKFCSYCADCGKEDLKRNMMTIHISDHTGVKQVFCHLCDGCFRELVRGLDIKENRRLKTNGKGGQGSR